MTKTDLYTQLKKNILGDVHTNAMARRLYSVDASIYEVEPLAVVVPKSIADIKAAIQIAREAQVPIVPRGAATGIAGGCLSSGIVIDTSKYMNRILECNLDEEWVLVEPGVVQDQLNAYLSEQGYRLGPDTSTGNRATVGGMAANNSAGARSLRFGQMVDHVLATELILASGDLLVLSEVDASTSKQLSLAGSVEGQIYRTVLELKERLKDEIANVFPKLPRKVSGYNFDELIKPGPLNLAKLIVGSEGTLGIITRLKLRIVKKPKASVLAVLHFDSLFKALKSVGDLLNAHPLALELIDREIIAQGIRSKAMRGHLDWLEGEPEALLVAEIDADDIPQATKKAQPLLESYQGVIVDDEKEMENVWRLRKSGLGLLMSRRTYSRGVAFIEDVAVPPDQLAEFVRDLFQLLKKYDKAQGGIYGHVGAGCLHIRPYIDLTSEAEQKTLRQIMREVADLLLEYGGAYSAEHGDGLIRSWLTEKMFGARIYAGFQELKAAFDPEGRMNPGKIVNAPDVLTNLRFTPRETHQKIQTVLDFSEEGGFELSADLCNGNGQCRKTDGLMCPSFQAYHDERHTTRARAQSLRAIVNGRMPMEAFTSRELYDILDYCLECKGCKVECPSQVDMAKMKSEFLHHYHAAHGLSLRTRLFGNVGRLAQLAAFAPRITNWTLGTRLAKQLLRRLGVTPHRSLPSYAKKRFSKQIPDPKPPKRGQVVLFNDTYTEFHLPEVGLSAYHLLSSLGFEVVIPPWQCCGRPALSKGLLSQARGYAEQLIETLFPLAQQGIDIIGLEPSCILTIKDDYKSLTRDPRCDVIALQCVTLDSFLLSLQEKGELDLPFNPTPESVHVHIHCHQKALVGPNPTIQLLDQIPGCEPHFIDAGCCGLAGSFGYEREHYPMSMKIGENTLFPAIRETELPVIASGFSCRCQIEHGTLKKPLHLAQYLTSKLLDSKTLDS